MIIPVTAGVTGVVRKELKKMCKPLQENTQQFRHKNSYTRNITHNTESAAVSNWKLEWWGSLLVREEKFQGEEACDNERYSSNNRNVWGFLSSLFSKERYKGSKGCQDQLLISKVMLQECSSRKKIYISSLLGFYTA